jgi:hypothetical protein
MRGTVSGRGLVFYVIRAEGVGFEPTNRGYLLAVFKSACGNALTCTFLASAGNFAAHLP